MATAQEAANSIVASFITAASEASNTYSFSWTKPVVSGTDTELIPTSYVLAYALSEELPTQISTTGPLYAQYGMELITEVPGNVSSYQLFTSSLDFYEDAVWAIYPLFNTGTTGIVPGALVFAKTYAAGGGFNRFELNDPSNMAINTSTNDIYFAESNWKDSDNLNYRELISKLSDNKTITHINGAIGNPDVLTSSIYKNVIAVNSNTNKLIRLGGPSKEVVTIYDLNSNTKELEYDLGNVKIIFGLEPFVWDNRFFVMNEPTSDSNAVTGIFEIDTSLPTFSINTGLTRTLLNTYAGEAGQQTWFDYQFEHPTAFADVEVGQAVKNSFSGGLVMSKPNSTTIVIKTTYYDTNSLSFAPVKWHMARLGRWGANSSGAIVGTATQPINTEYWNTVIPYTGYTANLSTVDNNNLITAKRDELRIINLQNKTTSTSTTTGLTFGTVNRTTIGGNGAAKAGYILHANSKVFKLSGSVWTLFAEAPSVTYFNDIIWSVEDNCFYATQRIGNVGVTYDIKRITVDGVVEDIADIISDGSGEETDTGDDFGVDFGGGTGGSGGGVDVKPPVDEGDIKVEIDDPEDPTLPGPYVSGVSPDDIFSLRKNRDILYILRNGIIIWTYKLNPRQLYNMKSTKYIGWIDRVTGEPIETPEDAVYVNFNYSFDYTFNGTIEEPMASTDILFTYGKHYQGQSLVVWDDGELKIDRFTLEEDLKTADYYVPGGRVFTLSNGKKAKSPLIPYWVLKILVDNNFQQYLVKVEDL
jgi:hypothetical protein